MQVGAPFRPASDSARDAAAGSGESEPTGVLPLCDLHYVGVDLSLPEWPEKLVAAGFNASRPSIWLLEGLTGYLTEGELGCVCRAGSDTGSSFHRPPPCHCLRIIPTHALYMIVVRQRGGWNDSSTS